MDVAVRKLLLVCANFVQFWSHLSICMSSTHLASENMTSLCCSSLLLVSVRATNGVRSSVLTASRIDFRNNVHLVLIIHNKFLSISSVNCAHSTSRSSRNDLALRCNGWDFVIVLLIWHVWHILLYWSQHRHIIMLVVDILIVFHEVSWSCSS